MRGRGFTLFELLIVLTVGAILLTIAIPGLSFLVNASRLAAVSNNLVVSLQLARSEAIKRGQRVTVCKTSGAMAITPACDASANWQEGWLVFVDGGIPGVIEAGDTLLRAQGPASTAVAITVSNYSTYISYLSSGVSQAPNNLANGKLLVCLAGYQREVIINRMGRMRLESSFC
jgi:type IV fimbrial biogenesis protein FimT